MFLFEVFQLRAELSDLGDVVSNKHLTTIILDVIAEEMYTTMKVQSIRNNLHAEGKLYKSS